MRFAFLILGEFNGQRDRAEIHYGQAQIIGVSSLREACEIAGDLLREGVECIELCGAFGDEGARQVIEATHNSIPIGYVVHLPQQEELYRRVFG